MVRARVVPWKDDQEWEEVRSSLYAFIGPDCSEKGARERTKWGVDRIKHGALAALYHRRLTPQRRSFEVALRDPHFGRRHDEKNDAEPVVTEHELRLLYSMTFVRFVNSLVGTIQQGQFACGITGPSTRSADLALSWLDANYWSAQQAYVIKSDTVILALVRQYRSVRVTITLQRPVDTKNVNPHFHMSRILGEIADTISSEEDLHSLLDVLLPPIEGLPSAPPELMTESVCPEPAVVVKLWQPLVRSLAESVEEFA
ncbi:hypothetical protein M427DRAFT_36443 [Gonapodya prolifera JEL478]|uniref:Uncharacterized protein n=1 Tax=Gonapodya prolifera (strain JEL478) TaxID=1344416 RepID=A0A139A2J1_GONPJ|nr:hypothetical protein M427DRAFT_36443 [Gonapodya prolifera JEL478]|eukprot:KXS10982.1 hypothetical protein M427DRAFT_36443 [Gonapodya prolifera JEL478]